MPRRQYLQPGKPDGYYYFGVNAGTYSDLCPDCAQKLCSLRLFGEVMMQEGEDLRGEGRE